MTRLFVPRERPLASMALGVLTVVDATATALGVDYFVTGAMVREILLRGVFGIETGRATLDVDIAVEVDTWAEFDAVKARLLKTETMRSDPKMAHRLWFRAYPLDVLPFGGVEAGQHQIAWPPDGSMIMDVVGYREALVSAQKVEVSPGLVVPVTSLPAFAILKLFAWADRGTETSKDAGDLARVLRSYQDAGNEDRLYGDEIQVLEAADYNVELAGPRLLGRDARRLLTPETWLRVKALLGDRARVDRLVSDLARELRSTDDPVAEADHRNERSGRHPGAVEKFPWGATSRNRRDDDVLTFDGGPRIADRSRRQSLGASRLGEALGGLETSAVSHHVCDGQSGTKGIEVAVGLGAAR